MAAASSEIARMSGRIIHQFSPTVFVAELPDNLDVATLISSSDQPIQPLDEISQLAVTAWTTARAAKEARVAAAPSQTEGLQWDTPGFDPPREFGTPVAFARAVADTGIVSQSTGTPTSLYMVGSVAVGVVMVSRNAGAEVLTATEQLKIVQEVQEGLDWLAGVEPRAKVSFVYDIRPVTVTSAPGPYPGVTEPYERFERDWRDAALAAMGYPAGRPGYQQYANDLRSSRHTDWAYVAFFTKYPLNHFAYAVVEKVVMNFANDGWGPDNINRVFAHETCHIFGAADEYGSCSCGSTSGHLSVPNSNCVNCFPPGVQVPCLMNANTLEMCDFSRMQIGWDNRLFPSGGFSSLGGIITNDPSVGRNADGRLEVFARGTDNALHHIWQTSAGGGWSGWNSLGGALTSNTAVAINHDGRLEVFVRGTDDALHHNWQTSAGGGWSGWNSLGGALIGNPVVAINHDGRLEVFVRGTDNALHHNWQTSAGGGWSGWNSLGGKITSDPSVGRNADGRLEVFARGTDNALHHNWQTSAGGGWSGWNSLGGALTSNTAVAINHDGRLEVFVRGTDNALHHNWQTSAGGGWAGWNSLGGKITSDPSVGRNADGRLEVFARGTDNALHHIWQTSAGGGWSGWNSLGGGLTSNTAVAINHDGRLEIFVRGTDDALWHRWQTTAGGAWN